MSLGNVSGVRRLTENRRRHARYACAVPAEVSVGSRAPVLTETEDLSEAGLALRLPPQLKVDDRVVVVLRPGGAIIPLLGRVAWLADDAAVAGVEFERLTPGPERTLRAVLDWQEAASLGIRRRRTAPRSHAQN